MREQLVLDPYQVARGRTELDITRLVGEGGPDFGEAALEQFLAKRQMGQIPVDADFPNRQIQIPLMLRDADNFTYQQLREFIQNKVGLIQREGGWLKRELVGGNLYCDLVGASLHMGASTASTLWEIDPDAVLTLDALPDFYGDEIAYPVHTDTSSGQVIFTEIGVKGDLPGRCRLVVTEEQAATQQSLLWGFRSRHWHAASTARLVYNAEGLTPLDLASVFSTFVTHPDLGAQWTPVLSTDTATGPLTHSGTYRVLARIQSDGGPTVKARFVWDVGDMTLPEENPPWTFPAADQWYVADLGEVRIDPAPTGTHRWRGHIQAAGTGHGILVDKLWFVPLDDGAGVLRASSSSASLSAYSARDEFNQALGFLNGKVMPVGGTWATSGGATDFQIQDSPWGPGSKVLARAQFNDPALGGRLALAGSGSYAALTSQVDFLHSVVHQGALDDGVPATNPATGLRQRYVDANNSLWVRAVVQAASLGQSFLDAGQPPRLITQISVDKRVGGTYTAVGRAEMAPLGGGVAYTLRVATDAQGRVQVWLFPSGASPGNPIISTTDTDLATGGPLASGRAGFYDEYPYSNVSAPLNVRWYDNFYAWPTESDAVLFPNRSAEISTYGMFRESSDGGAYGPVDHVEGDLPRVAPSGLEGRTLEVLIKGSRGDMDQLPDTAIDDLSAQLFYRPCWLFVPEITTSTGLFPALDLFPAPDLFPEAYP